jgi:hypothetical protein
MPGGEDFQGPCCSSPTNEATDFVLLVMKIVAKDLLDWQKCHRTNPRTRLLSVPSSHFIESFLYCSRCQWMMKSGDRTGGQEGR